MSDMKTLWARKVERALEPLQEVPLFGAPPSIDWPQLSTQLAKALSLEGLAIEMQPFELSHGKQLLSGFGEAPQVISFELSPLTHSAYLAMPREDIDRLALWTLGNAVESGFSDTLLKQGYFKAICLQVAKTLSDHTIFGDLTPKLSSHSLTSDDECVVSDISLTFNESTIWARLILPLSFKRAITHHFASKPATLDLAKKHPNLEVSLKLEAGSTQLTQEELSSLEVGDFLVLDNPTYSPTTKQGRALIKLEQTPLFYAKPREEGTLEILDYAQYSKEETSQ